MTPIEPEAIANATPEQIADMRIEIVKRELSQGALAGLDSSVTDYAARLVVAALDTFDEYLMSDAYQRGFEAGELNHQLLQQQTYRNPTYGWHLDELA